jgi:ribosome biogenesis protein SSF1/2
MGKSKRKKKRTAGDDDSEGLGVASKPPRTFVMERGSVGRILHELMTDLRQVMEPYTASKLKVTKRNVLKDFIHIAGPLGVTHFIMISKTNDNVNFKITKLPRGPTVTFHLTQVNELHVIYNAKGHLLISTNNQIFSLYWKAK